MRLWKSYPLIPSRTLEGSREVRKADGKASSMAPPKPEKPKAVNNRLDAKEGAAIGRALWGISLRIGKERDPVCLMSPTSYRTLCFAPWPVVCIALLFLRRGWFPSYMLG